MRSTPTVIGKSELAVLKRRYLRLIKFDRGLWVVYGLFSLAPLYVILSSDSFSTFHIIALISIVGVACFGWQVDTGVLHGKIRAEWPAYAVTVCFVVSRLMLAAYVLYLSNDRFSDPADTAAFFTGVLQVMVSLPVALLLLIATTYRSIYHISVHFLLKIRSLESAGQNSAQSRTVLP